MDEMEILEQMCATVPPPDADHLARLRTRVLDGTADDPVRPRPKRVRPASARRAQLAFAGCALAAAAGLVATLVSAPHGGSTAPVPSASAARILQHAADVALTEPVAPDGKLVYTEITGHSRFGPLGAKTIVEQMWQSVDGSRAGAVKITPCSPLTPGSYDSGPLPARRVGHRLVPVRLFNSAKTCVLAIDTSRSLPAVASYAGLRTLPENPAALLAYINSHAIRNQIGGLKSQLQWNAIQDILRDNPSIPPTVAAALFRAAATLPGTVVQQHVTDAAGQPGVAVAMQYRGLSSELIFDPSTYRFIGSADVVTSHGSFRDPIGTVFYTMAVLHTAIVTSAPSVGPGSYQPAVSTEFRP